MSHAFQSRLLNLTFALFLAVGTCLYATHADAQSPTVVTTGPCQGADYDNGFVTNVGSSNYVHCLINLRSGYTLTSINNLSIPGPGQTLYPVLFLNRSPANYYQSGAATAVQLAIPNHPAILQIGGVDSGITAIATGPTQGMTNATRIAETTLTNGPGMLPAVNVTYTKPGSPPVTYTVIYFKEITCPNVISLSNNTNPPVLKTLLGIATNIYNFGWKC